MLFRKLIHPALAVFGFAAIVMANPLQASVSSVAAPNFIPLNIISGVTIPVLSNSIHRREDLILNAVRGVLDNVTPLAQALTDSAIDIETAIGAIVDLLSNAKVDIAGLAAVDLSTDVDAITDVNVKLVMNLLYALSVKDVLDLFIIGKIDTALSEYLTALTQVKADIGVKIGHGISVANVDFFGTVKLVLTGHILDLVQAPGL